MAAPKVNDRAMRVKLVCSALIRARARIAIQVGRMVSCLWVAQRF